MLEGHVAENEPWMPFFLYAVMILRKQNRFSSDNKIIFLIVLRKQNLFLRHLSHSSKSVLIKIRFFRDSTVNILDFLHGLCWCFSIQPINFCSASYKPTGWYFGLLYLLHCKYVFEPPTGLENANVTVAKAATRAVVLLMCVCVCTTQLCNHFNWPHNLMLDGLYQ